MHAGISEYDIMLRHSCTGLTNCMHELSTRVTERGSGVFLLEPAPTAPATASPSGWRPINPSVRPALPPAATRLVQGTPHQLLEALSAHLPMTAAADLGIEGTWKIENSPGIPVCVLNKSCD